MKYNKLPSGKWNVKVFDYYDENGKQHNKSFTAPTKGEIKQMIAEWQINRQREQRGAMTVLEACTRCLELKKPTLSPTTIREYGNGINNAIKPYRIAKKDIFQLKSADVQLWISELAETRAPKTVRNYYAQLVSAVDMFNPDIRIKVKLPEKVLVERYCPSSEDIKQLLSYLEEQGLENIRLAVLLASVATMRRAEICALTSDDIDTVHDTITVNKSLVKDETRSWVIKTPKNYTSNRVIRIPHSLALELKAKNGRIVTCVPDTISDDFKDLVKAAGLQRFRFHDLRHYSASIMAYLLISDTTSQKRGGWASNNVMKSVYMNQIDLEKEREEKKINSYFEDKLLS